MRYECIEPFIFPESGRALRVERVETEVDKEIKEGLLKEDSGEGVVPIRNYIPRFRDEGPYVSSFGKQWNRYRRTQMDSVNGTSITSERFYHCTGWSREELKGQRILEVGCGAGRFTQIMLNAGATVYALDYSLAVDACRENNAPHPNLCIVQGDLYRMPFRQGFFDKVFCYGVLQHTPDVKGAFMSLLPFLKKNGKIAIDVYIKQKWPSRWASKNLWRPITKRMPHELLFRIIEGYIPFWLPIDNFLQRIPGIGKLLTSLVPCWNYSGMWAFRNLTSRQVKEWAILDTFDALSPCYDSPQTIDTVRSWFEEARINDISVRIGGNGILGNGTN